MSTIGINRLVDGVLTSAEETRVSIVSWNGLTVVAPTIVTPTSPGVYTYDVTFLVPGAYTAEWSFYNTGFTTDVVDRAFTVDSAISNIQGVTLAEIERAVARVVGPFHMYRAKVGSTIQGALVGKLKSSLALGDYEEMYILRRGVLNTGAFVPAMDPEDRQRLVDTYDNVTGMLTPDQDWANPPVEDEILELHALDPEDELRPAVLDGLARCYFWDVVTISATAYMREINLTNLAPWITRKNQVQNAQYGRAGYMPNRVPYFGAYQSGGSVMLQTIAPNIGSLRVTALRPVSSLVNNEYSPGGPNDDHDILRVDLRYAKLAGHLEAWNNFPDRLAPLAVNKLRADQKSVADAFTIRSRAMISSEPEFIQNRFGLDDILEDLQVGNA